MSDPWIGVLIATAPLWLLAIAAVIAGIATAIVALLYQITGQ